MHQSLLNQFRGAYLGAALGDVLSVEPTGRNNRLEPPLPMGAIALAYTKDLLGISQPQAGVEWTPAQSTPLQGMAIQVALCLPTAVYLHDDLTTFQQQMVEQRRVWSPALVDTAAPEAQLLADGLLMLALVMSSILQQQFDPKNTVNYLHDTLSHRERSPLSVQYLACLKMQLDQGHPLAIARLHLESIATLETPAQTILFALVLALYIALSSPTDLPLTFRRIQSMPTAGSHNLPWTAQRLIRFVAGMIVGAYNGLEGIPLMWRHCLTPESYRQAQPVSVDVLEAYWNLRSEIELLQLVDLLFAQWSGADEFSRFLSTVPLLAIASPATIYHRCP